MGTRQGAFEGDAAKVAIGSGVVDMTFANPSTALAETLVDEMIRGGVRYVVASPGSRSTALVLAFHKRPEIELFMQIDERSAAFRALGLACTSEELAVVVTTSGSAVANLLPAVVEADRSMVPLGVLTADRPVDSIRRRANQTTNHLAVFDGFVRRQINFEPATVDIDGNSTWRLGVSETMGAALGGDDPPGPVHINVAFDEPTVPVSDDGRSRSKPYTFRCDGAKNGHSWTTRVGYQPSLDLALPDLGDRVVIAIGRGDFEPSTIASLAKERGIPLLASSLSGARGDNVVSGYHYLLAEGFPAGMRPSGVVIVGDLNPSDRIHSAISEGIPAVHIDKWGVYTDPLGRMSLGIRADPASVIQRLGPQQEGWAQTWNDMDVRIRSILTSYLEASKQLSGAGLAHGLTGLGWDALVVGSSLAIRDVDKHLAEPGVVISNRGVSGIDGFVSTALGVGSVFQKTLGYVGDLSFLHDANGFLGEALPPVVFLVMDNDGGGLFDLLPQSNLVEDFERLFVTPPDRDLKILAEFHHLRFLEIEAAGEIKGAVEDGFSQTSPTLVRARVDRHFDLSVREDLDRLARDTLPDL
jgi:2-succinyl-5-enolpyruvyl-6-hydroxy-3-cyclohexene-1-carboxylate synthase